MKRLAKPTRLRWRLTTIAAVMILFGPSADSIANSSLPHLVGPIAVSPSTILATASGGCTGLGVASLWISHDRGISWRKSGCIPADRTAVPPLRADAILPQAFYWVSGLDEVITLDATGHIVRRTATGFEVPAAQVAGALYTTGVGTGHRIDGSGSHACGVPPNALLQDASAQLVLATDSKTGAPYVSRDACASFAPLPASPAQKCSYSFFGPADVGCYTSTNNQLRYYVNDGVSDSWSESLLLETASCPGALSNGNRRITCMDQFSSTSAPDTWPTTLPTSGKTAPLPYRSAIAYANARYRLPMGLPPLRWSPLLAKAAAAHQRYLTLNPPQKITLALHEEQPGRRGYTGQQPFQRCEKAGYLRGCGEDIAPTNAPYPATAILLQLPLHGSPYLISTTIGMASGKVTGHGAFTVVEFDMNKPPVSDLDIPPNRPNSWLHVWPTNGTKNVPAAWNGGEIPDPLRSYRGDHANVGPALFVQSALPVDITLTGPSGPVPLIQAGGTHAVTTLAGGANTLMLAGHRLAFRATYRLNVRTVADLGLPSATFRFTTS